MRTRGVLRRLRRPFFTGLVAVLLGLLSGGRSDVFNASGAHPHGCALIIVGDFSPTWLSGKLARNICAEAASDFQSLGYSVDILWQPNSRKIYEKLGACDVRALVTIAHGTDYGFEPQKGLMLYYSALGSGFDRRYDYVILHSCFSRNADSVGFFGPRSSYFFGWRGYTTLYSVFFRQWLLFPSEGPHFGDYEPIDTDSMWELSAEEAAAIPFAGELWIPPSAQDTAKYAFLRLAEGHNLLIWGYEEGARLYIEEAIWLLEAAHSQGWDLAQIIADELSAILSGHEGICPCYFALRVPEDYSTIGAAIKAASPGDCISVAPGTYREELWIDKDIFLYGAGADVTTIEGKITIATGAPHIEGFRITGSYSGIVVNHYTSPSIWNNVIEGNNYGIVIWSHSEPNISYNVIKNNRYCGVSIDEPERTTVTGTSNEIYGNGQDLCPEEWAFPIGFRK